MSEQPYLREINDVSVQKASDWDVDGQHSVELQWEWKKGLLKAKIGDALAMNGEVYQTIAEADQKGGGVWGVLVTDDNDKVLAWNKEWISNLDTYRFSLKTIFSNDPVPPISNECCQPSTIGTESSKPTNVLAY